jgi:hypothetical protein
MFADRRSLVDHALSAHVSAPTRAAGIRAPEHPKLVRAIAVIGMLLGAGTVVAVIVLSIIGFDKDAVPETPNSLAHQVALELQAAGTIENYRAVDPDGDWEVEYELDGEDFDGPDAAIRSSGGAGPESTVEYETFLDDDLYDALEQALERRGFVIEED